jgi:hypothetical protein
MGRNPVELTYPMDISALSGKAGRVFDIFSKYIKLPAVNDSKYVIYV